MSEKYQLTPMKKKYQLVLSDSIVIGSDTELYRIQALGDFGDVKAGDLGGYIQSEDNLSHLGTCWVYNEAQVYDDAGITGSAQIRDYAFVRGSATVGGEAVVMGNAGVTNMAAVTGHAKVSGNSTVSGGALVCGYAKVYGGSVIRENAVVADFACVDSSVVAGYANIIDHALLENVNYVGDHVMVYGTAQLTGDIIVEGLSNVSCRIERNVRILSGDIRCDISPFYRDNTEARDAIVRKRVECVHRRMHDIDDEDIMYEVLANVLRIRYQGLVVKRDNIIGHWQLVESRDERSVCMSSAHRTDMRGFAEVLNQYDVEIDEDAEQLIDMVAGFGHAKEIKEMMRECE